MGELPETTTEDLLIMGITPEMIRQVMEKAMTIEGDTVNSPKCIFVVSVLIPGCCRLAFGFRMMMAVERATTRYPTGKQ